MEDNARMMEYIGELVEEERRFAQNILSREEKLRHGETLSLDVRVRVNFSQINFRGRLRSPSPGRLLISFLGRF